MVLNIAITFCNGYTPPPVYYFVYLPRMAYIFPTAPYSKTKLEALEWGTTRAVLAKLGYNGHTPTDVVYDIGEYGGIGICRLFIELGIAQKVCSSDTFVPTTLVNCPW